jgi:hypothetical protein
MSMTRSHGWQRRTGAGLGAGWFLKPTAAPAAVVPEPASAGGEAGVADKSIAVLPLDDFSPGRDQTFADGLAEEILNSLARAPDLKVASRTASFAFRGSTEDLSEIARRLEARAAFERAVAIDPRFARAHHALAIFWSREIAFNSEWPTFACRRQPHEEAGR